MLAGAAVLVLCLVERSFEAAPSTIGLGADMRKRITPGPRDG